MASGLNVTTDRMVTTSEEHVDLTCTFSANPQGTIVIWVKDEVQITRLSNCSTHLVTSCQLEIYGRDKYSLSGSLESVVSLHIKDITLGDGGNYECRVSSVDGYSKSSVHVQVIGKCVILCFFYYYNHHAFLFIEGKFVSLDM